MPVDVQRESYCITRQKYDGIHYEARAACDYFRIVLKTDLYWSLAMLRFSHLYLSHGQMMIWGDFSPQIADRILDALTVLML